MSWLGDPFTYYKIEVPTVVGQLRNILTQYPDNGQIIKELIQNAEDAGASTVEVVHIPDRFSCPEAQEVVRRFLQGPAVCLYNDAVFMDEDWHGIRKLSESIKEENPLQVGQFGLGFKSVFHLTDFVTIISGQEVLFMDPSEPEERMCRCLPLQQLSEVLPVTSMQHVFGHRLTPQQQAAGSFPGTLLWFPLRQTPSKISDTVYTAEHVKRLFGSFAVEASGCLTFLKSLEKITIGRVESQQVTVTQCVQITSSNMTQMRNKRQAFRQELQQCNGSPSEALCCSYDATLHTGDGGSSTQHQHMRILHLLPGKKDAEWMKWGGKDTSKHIPLVGVAVPTSTPAEATGHVFSFLPLPPDPTNQTGLPIQVNGAFILNQNRRQVKWRTSESSLEADVMWNEELVVKVVARAYTRLLRQLLREAEEGSMDATAWYTFLPDLSAVAGRWLKMGEKVWQDFLSLDIIFSEVSGFLAVQDVLTCNALNDLEPPEVASTVKRVLCSQSLPLATLPSHVLKSLHVLGQDPSSVTPRHLRSTLSKCSTLRMEWNRKHLLCYAAEDAKYEDLCGLSLLPLQDKTWGCFRFGAKPVYLCSRQEAEALQGLEGQVVDVSVAPPVLKILQAVAESGVTQVCRFQAKQHGPKLLEKSVTNMQNCHLSSEEVERWLSAVWSIVQHLDLQSVEHIPLLPTSQPPCVQDLASLASPLVQQGRGKLSRPQVEVLGLLGVVVVPALPSYVRHVELQGRLDSSDCYGTTQALNKAASKKNQTHTASHFNSRKTEEQRQALHSLIDTHSMQPQLKSLLRVLRVFKAQDRYNHVTDACLAAVNVMAPGTQDFPTSYPETLLTPSLPEEETLALALGAMVLCQSELCVKALRSCCGDEDTSRLVGYILRDAQLAVSSAVLQELRNTKFVPSMAGQLCRPAELYDPEDIDCDALIGETQTPGASFRQHLPLLRSLGLRKLQDTHWKDLVSLIKCLQNTLLSKAQRAKKSAGLLQAINRHTECQLICQEVMGVPFVFGASRPLEYPASLQWGTPTGMLQPQVLTSCQHSEVCGSAQAVVRCYDVPAVAEACGWTAPPPVDTVIRHLHNIKAAYQQDELTKYFSLVKKTYRQLAVLLDGGAAQLAGLKTDACIFTEQGFKSPTEVYIRPGDEDLHLQPYLHPLPLELRESKSLFLHLGCASQQTPALLLAVLQAIRERHQATDSSREEVERDRQLVVLVLERLQHHTGKLAGPLLVPVRTQHDALELVEVQHSAYTDATTDWIDSDELEVSVVHQCVGVALARALGVAPLQNFLSAGGEAVMEWGQREPLTTRLHNLLRQYRDGVSILKELVQNADDAGATTVQLLYDQRQNEGSRTLLLGSGMAQCQGPALWVYNDACFSEQDFKNLQKIGAGTKELQPTKIGKFGLGFCSVYNLTDVPSFVSGSSYVVFDPHMTHLDAAASSPGMRYDFTTRRNSYMLRTLQGQFQPFKGVFGCDIQEHGSFPATLFRLPLRTPTQASASKISDVCYSHQDMVQLLGMFSAVVGQLLLFTQHVSSISVCHLLGGAASPTEMAELFCASRGSPGSIPNLLPLPTISTQSLLERTAALFSQQQKCLKWDGDVLVERSTTEVRVWNSQKGAALCGIEEGEWGTTWVTSWHSGSAKSCCLAEIHQGRALPLAAMAVPVCHSGNGWQLQCLADLPSGFYHEGHFHCFLPLPVKTSLPVQVNGVLEVASDRTSLLTQTEDDRHACSWNATLLGDAAVHAHLGLAEALRHLGLCAGNEYHATWPAVGCGGGPLVESFTTSFYHTLQEEDLELFQCGRGEWHPFSRCRILEEDFLQVPEVGDTAFEFLEACLHESSEIRMVRLPRHMQAGFDRQVLALHIITQEMFFRQYFVPHLSAELVSTKKRDLLTIHLLESGHHYVELLRSLPCIPTQPHGTPRPPWDLIRPKTEIAKLFSLEDERFPMKNFLDPFLRSSALSKLGMSTDNLPQELVVERAQSVAGLARTCPECARHRVSELLHYISMQDPQKQGELAHKLRPIPFLPVMPKPERWSVAWCKECPAGAEPQWCSSHRGVTTRENDCLPMMLERPPALCLPKFKPLVGSFHALLEESSRRSPQEVLERLGVTVHAHSLPLVSVVKQLCEFSTAAAESDNVLMCHAIYEHLEDLITLIRRGKNMNNINEIKKLHDKKILATSHGFASPRLFAVHSESNCAPDLFSAHTEGLEKYEYLMDILGIRENYEFKAVMEVIQKKRETFADRRLGYEDVLQVSRLLSVLFQVKEGSEALEQVLHLPDSQGLLRSTWNLCRDDGAELSSGQFLFLHPSISVSQDMSEWLGIKSKTRKRLSESSSRLRFGQMEPLTTRLWNILSDYPCDSGIMKELLQNADDAGATEVTFYKDFRRLPDQKLFDPMWAPLQGPALIVFNNKGFTEQDLQSIQDLGNSSKREDPATTGQYGIGFNAVYHLTDAPSFLTKGPQVPQGETLCMFDPHCWYDPSATPESPGVQFINLSDLRQDHPDSFTGYLEQHFPQEGTMLRLPLRRVQDSLISKEILKEDHVCKMLKEFERQMPQCLLFLRNVRKVSIKKVQSDGQCKEEYSVQATAPKNSDLPALTVKYRDAQETRDPCALDMTRTSCTMTIQDSRGSSSQWLVVQQLGVKEKNSLPKIVREAFSLKTLNMLPHGGVAILLDRNTHASSVNCPSDLFSTSCYLPLPAQSGLPFSINGHFTLNSARRDLWMGHGDTKGLWNEWLLKELLVPVAVHAVEEFRTQLFPGDGDSHMTENNYASKVQHFHHVLPLASKVHGEKWKNFVKWFYEQVREEQLHFFDSFIPEADLPPPSLALWRREPAQESRKGRLVWHAFHASGDQFPVYFTSAAMVVADILKRLGMKVSSKEMHCRLEVADREFQCSLLTPDVALTFIKSWNQDVRDRCRLQVGSQVSSTPFLKPDNVLSVLQYIMDGEGFSDASVDGLPLLVTNNNMLGCFSIQDPVFLSSFCDLLPNFKKEFTLRSFCDLLCLDFRKEFKLRGHVKVIKAIRDEFKDVVKPFTLADLGERLPHMLDAAQCAADARLPLPDRKWLLDLWRFVVQYVEKAYCQEGQIDWAQARQYILRTLGKWAFYPVTERGQAFVIPIEQAWQVLDVSGHIKDSAFCKLPVPVPLSVGSKDHEGGLVFSMNRNHALPAQKQRPKNPYIPKQLQLATTLTDPAAVLQLLDFHRVFVNLFFQECSQRGNGKVDIDEILEYLGKHCSKCSLPRNKIRALQVFPGPSGRRCTLQGRELVVLAESVLKLDKLEGVCSELSLLVVPKPDSDNVTNLYKYIEPNCLLEELELYTRLILPNMRLLNETQRLYYLDNLRKILPYGSEMEWNAHQQRLIATLRTCPFIDLHGTLKTADQFYDHLNKVFCVMGLATLPEAWRKGKWRCLLKLAGMVHSISPEMFVGFASSLSVRDESVKEKSEVLCKYLEDHHEELQPKISEILDIEFLVPKKDDELQALLPHHQTHSGLLAFSEGINPKFANIIWSTRSLLPLYVTGVAIFLPQVNMKSPPAADILEHIVNFCSSMQAMPEKSPKVVGSVMESIYEHLSQHGENEMQSLKERDVPIIHLPDHSTFVSTSRVVGSLEEEILPYLYKAPVAYGKFFGMFEGLGMPDSATPNTYAHVLEMIHKGSEQKILHPEEARQMKMAFKGLVKNRYKLKDLSVSELYLPAWDGTLRSSSQMFVADTDKLLVVVQKVLQEPIFVGFRHLKIDMDDSSFVVLLPQRLRPKLLSEACKTTLQQEGMLDEATMLLDEIHELLQSQEFKSGALRIIHHYKLQNGSALTKKEEEEVLALLARVTVRQVNIIKTTITLHNTIVGQKERQDFIEEGGEGDQRTWILYLSKKIPSRMIPSSLCQVYARVLSKFDTGHMREFSDIFACHGKPHDIHKFLDEREIKKYSANTPMRGLFMCDVGTYLEERFLPLLDNSFSVFHEKEIVCMKKYLCGKEGADPEDKDVEENDIFVVVKVVQLVEKHPTCHMQNTYQVNTTMEPPCLVTVKAHQLYRFIRKDDVTSQPEPESREDILREIREQLRKIWQVEDEQEKRHLLRRLQFRWHPDKNPEQVELCTQAMQYMMSLVGRLECGEAIPEEEDPNNPPQATPSRAYSHCFCPPPQRYRNRNRNRAGAPPPRRHRPDLTEARSWLRQAHSDLEAAEAVVEQVPWWAVFMCYQAAEKVLLAALFMQDREEASRQQRNGPLKRTLADLALLLDNPRAIQLASTIQQRTGGFLKPLYPTFAGCPRDSYTLADANQVLPPCRELLQELGENIM